MIEEVLQEAIQEMARKSRQKGELSLEPQCSLDEYKEKLVELYEIFVQKHELKPGDLVRQKRSLGRHYKHSGVNHPAIVIGFIEGVRGEPDGGPYASESKDMEVGLWLNGDFERVIVDSRWFEPWTD